MINKKHDLDRYEEAVKIGTQLEKEKERKEGCGTEFTTNELAKFFVNGVKWADENPKWKPSELQLDTLEQIIDGDPYNHNVLVELFNSLKRIK